MKLSPLQLKHYFVADLRFTAVTQFDPAKEVELKEELLVVEPICKREREESLQWQVTLNLKLDAPVGSNIPYKFAIFVVGIFEVHPNFPRDKSERMVHTNAPSVLFGILREVVRDLTMRGPYSGLILPSVSFYVEPNTTDSVATKVP